MLRKKTLNIIQSDLVVITRQILVNNMRRDQFSSVRTKGRGGFKHKLHCSFRRKNIGKSKSGTVKITADRSGEIFTVFIGFQSLNNI